MFGLKGYKELKGELKKPKCEPKKPKCVRDFEEVYRSIRSEWSKTTNLCQKNSGRMDRPLFGGRRAWNHYSPTSASPYTKKAGDREAAK